jgi:hypothetical protein
MKNLVLFQVGNADIACSILNYIKNYLKNYNLFFIFSVLDIIPSDQITNLTDLLKKYNIEYKLFFHPNKGMDIGPYLLQLNYIFSNYSNDSWDEIFKIHTKTDSQWRNEMLDELFSPSKSPKWLFPLDNFNVNHINLICEKFGIPNIYYDDVKSIDDYTTISKFDISTNFYCEYYGIKLNNCSDLNKLLGYDYNLSHLYSHLIINKGIPNSSYILKKRRIPNIKFYAGSIFRIKFKKIYGLFSGVDLLKIYDHLEPGYLTNESSTYVHAMERIISGFVYL